MSCAPYRSVSRHAGLKETNIFRKFSFDFYSQCVVSIFSHKSLRGVPHINGYLWSSSYAVSPKKPLGGVQFVLLFIGNHPMQHNYNCIHPNLSASHMSMVCVCIRESRVCVRVSHRQLYNGCVSTKLAVTSSLSTKDTALYKVSVLVSVLFHSLTTTVCMCVLVYVTVSEANFNLRYKPFVNVCHIETYVNFKLYPTITLD